MKEWAGFDLAGGADAPGWASRPGWPTTPTSRGRRWSKGKGLELVVTLGTGVGTAFFYDGRLLPHLEFAHHPS